jgi:hypothetical protein
MLLPGEKKGAAWLQDGKFYAILMIYADVYYTFVF